MQYCTGLAPTFDKVEVQLRKNCVGECYKELSLFNLS